MLRDATPEDAARLTDIALAAKSSWGYPTEWLEAWRPQLRFTPESIRAAYVRVVEDAGVAVAVSALAEPDGPTAELDHLWVLPDHHGRGLGRRLMADAVRRARSLGYSSIRILSDPGARPFYERLGAVHVGEERADVCGTARTLPVLALRIDADTSGQAP